MPPRDPRRPVRAFLPTRPGAPRRALARPATLLATLLAAACGEASEDEEARLGREAAAQVTAQLPILADPVVTAYVDSLGTAIARRTARADLAWRFAVVDTDVVNAFALPGGWIFVNRGLIERAATMSELAGVLAHEVEHVVRRHSVEQMRKAQGAQTGVSLVCSLTGWCEGAAAQIGIQVGGSLLFARFGRAAEREADAGAFENVVRAGIDPRGMRSFFGQLAAEEDAAGGGAGPVAAWFADHPGTGERIAELDRMLAAVPAADLEGLRADDAGHQRVRDRLAALPPAPAAPPGATLP